MPFDLGAAGTIGESSDEEDRGSMKQILTVNFHLLGGCLTLSFPLISSMTALLAEAAEVEDAAKDLKLEQGVEQQDKFVEADSPR